MRSGKASDDLPFARTLALTTPLLSARERLTRSQRIDRRVCPRPSFVHSAVHPTSPTTQQQRIAYHRGTFTSLCSYQRTVEHFPNRVGHLMKGGGSKDHSTRFPAPRPGDNRNTTVPPHPMSRQPQQWWHKHALTCNDTAHRRRRSGWPNSSGHPNGSCRVRVSRCHLASVGRTNVGATNTHGTSSAPSVPRHRVCQV